MATRRLYPPYLTLEQFALQSMPRNTSAEGLAFHLYYSGVNLIGASFDLLLEPLDVDETRPLLTVCSHSHRAFVGKRPRRHFARYPHLRACA